MLIVCSGARSRVHRKDLASLCGVPSFNHADLLRPEPVRFRSTVTAIANFLKFRCVAFRSMWMCDPCRLIGTFALQGSKRRVFRQASGPIGCQTRKVGCVLCLIADCKPIDDLSLHFSRIASCDWKKNSRQSGQRLTK